MSVDTKKRNKRQQDWINNNKDRINIAFTKGIKEKVEQAAKAENISKSKWIENAIVEKLEREEI